MAVAAAAPVAPQLSSQYGAGTTAGGGTVNGDGSVTGSDGTIYVGGADSRAPVAPGALAPANANTPGPVNNGQYMPPGDVPGPDGKPITQAAANYLNELAAIQGPSQAPGVDMSGYIKSFNDSYNTQMANIKAGLTQSLGELQGRRDQAAAITAKFPQAVNSNYANVVNAGDARSAMSNLSPEAQAAAAPEVAKDASIGAANKASAKGDTAYQNLAITANTQSGEAALNASANSAEAGAAAQRDSASQALALQQAGFQDQYALARQTAGNQFTESQIAAGAQPSGIPGLTVAQYNAISSQPSFVTHSQMLTSMLTQPGSYTKAQYTTTLNSLTPQERAIINATNPNALNINQSLFSDPNKLAATAPAPYSTGLSGAVSTYNQGLAQEPPALQAINPMFWGSKIGQGLTGFGSFLGS